jgi:DNA helicase-2/ATP-dependent DNA helicase PcrA
MNDTDNFVTIATIHAVKGLEFRYVFIVGVEEGIFPVSRAYDKQEDMEEERRLMYVAITMGKRKADAFTLQNEIFIWEDKLSS